MDLSILAPIIAITTTSQTVKIVRLIICVGVITKIRISSKIIEHNYVPPPLNHSTL